MEFNTLIKHGTITIPSEHKNELEAMNDTKVIVSVKKYRNMRSKRQNRYYWGVVVRIIQEYSKSLMGEEYSKEEVHLFLIDRILGRKPEIKEVFGEHLISYNDVETSKMSTTEFGEFIMKIQKFFAERDIIIPDPEDGLDLPAGA